MSGILEFAASHAFYSLADGMVHVLRRAGTFARRRSHSQGAALLSASRAGCTGRSERTVSVAGETRRTACLARRATARQATGVMSSDMLVHVVASTPTLATILAGLDRCFPLLPRVSRCCFVAAVVSMSLAICGSSARRDTAFSKVASSSSAGRK
jgi:hypothetical protein